MDVMPLLCFVCVPGSYGEDWLVNSPTTHRYYACKFQSRVINKLRQCECYESKGEGHLHKSIREGFLKEVTAKVELEK